MDLYLDKFERVVDLLRTTGNYAAVLLTAPSLYTITSDVDTYLDEKDYVLLNGSIRARVVTIVNDKVFTAETFGNVVISGTWKSLAPYSDYGTRKSINTKLLQKNGGEFAYQKYPLIALRLPTTIRVTGDTALMNVNILIANFTSKTHTPQQRVEFVFEPILYPLKTLFLDMLRKSGEFIGYNKDYEWIDRMFYGTESGDESNIANVFDDPLDAIEIRNLELRYLVENCI